MITVLIDLDDTTFKYTEAYKIALALNPKIPYPQSQVGFFLWLTPIEDALYVIEWMFNNPEIDVWFCTAPSVRNLGSYSEKAMCVYYHLGQKAVDKLIFSPDKSMVDGDYLVDDITSGKGQEKFKGEIIHYGSDVYPNWLAIKEYFEEVLNNA